MLKFSFVGIVCTFLSACSYAGGNNELVAAARASDRYAEKDGIDFAEDRLRSVIEFHDARTSVIDVKDTGDYSTNIKNKLKGKKYWEACYSPIDDAVVGGGRCFFLNKSDLSLVAVYRSR